jgi:hypothetical protein
MVEFTPSIRYFKCNLLIYLTGNLKRVILCDAKTTFKWIVSKTFNVSLEIMFTINQNSTFRCRNLVNTLLFIFDTFWSFSLVMYIDCILHSAALKMSQRCRYRHIHFLSACLSFGLYSVIFLPTTSFYFLLFLFSFLHFSHLCYQIICSLLLHILIVEKCKWATFAWRRLWVFRAQGYSRTSFNYLISSDVIL